MSVNKANVAYVMQAFKMHTTAILASYLHISVVHDIQGTIVAVSKLFPANEPPR